MLHELCELWWCCSLCGSSSITSTTSAVVTSNNNTRALLSMVDDSKAPSKTFEEGMTARTQHTARSWVTLSRLLPTTRRLLVDRKSAYLVVLLHIKFGDGVFKDDRDWLIAYGVF